MAHRSDRRGGKPITALATKVVQAIGSPRADSMMARSHTAPRMRPKIRLQSGRCAVPQSVELPRRSARVKALRPPSAVRCAQP
jgi:hypothetical protein